MRRFLLALRHRAQLAAVGILWLALAACATDQALPPPHCAGDGSGVLFAQAVRTASHVPCFDPLPRGWSAASVDVNQERALVTLDSDRAGAGAAVLRFEAECDHAKAVSSPSEFAGVERYDVIDELEPRFQGRRYYLFPGGCVTWIFAFEADASASASIAIGESLSLISRESLNDRLHEEFIERDL